MAFDTDFSYFKTTGISVLLHGALIIALTLVGPLSPAAPPPLDDVVIEVIPAQVIDAPMPMLTPPTPVPPTSAPPTSAPPTPAMPEQQANPSPDRPQAVQEFARASTLSPALPGESAGSVAVPAIAGSGTVFRGNPGGTAPVSSGSGSSTGGGGVTGGASNIYSPRPAYPPDARRAGWEGSVLVRVLIDADGNVASVSVSSSSGYDSLDAAAAEGVQQWRFSPAKNNGVPVSSYKNLRIRFRLDEAD